MGKQPIILKVSPNNALFDKLSVVANQNGVTPVAMVARILGEHFKALENQQQKLEEIKERAQKLTYDQLMRFLELLKNRPDQEIHEMKITELAQVIKTIAQSLKDKGDTTINVTNQSLTVAVINRRKEGLKHIKGFKELGQTIETEVERD